MDKISAQFDDLEASIQSETTFGSYNHKSLVFPDRKFKINSNIKGLDQEKFMEVLQECILYSEMWNNIGYNVMCYRQDDNLIYQLTCKHTLQILEDLELTSIDTLIGLTLKLELRSPLETRFPLIFSFYGRRFTFLNYSYMKRNVALIKNSPINHMPTIQDHEVLLNFLQSLHDQCLQEYNTLSVMQENSRKRLTLLIPSSSINITNTAINPSKSHNTLKVSRIDVKNIIYNISLINNDMFQSLLDVSPTLSPPIPSCHHIVSVSDHHQFS